MTSKKVTPEIADAVVVGAGFGGMYQLYRLREQDFASSAAKPVAESEARGIGTGIRARAPIRLRTPISTGSPMSC